MASVLDLIKHYQSAIEKNPHDEQKILKCIDKLFNLDVTVQHLQETGVGRTVNALRKEQGDVGQAARALVYKWKLMVAAEESDTEEQNIDTSTYNGNGSGKESDDNCQKSSNQYEKSNKTSRSKEDSENYSESKRKYHSSEEEDTHKRRKHSTSSEDNYHNRKGESESESNDSDNSQSYDSDSETSDSSQEEVKVKQEIKKEHTSSHKSSSNKHSSHSEHADHKSSSSKKSHESDKHSKYHSSQPEVNTSGKSSLKEKSSSSSKHSSHNSEKPSSQSSDKHSSHSSEKHKGHNSDKHSSHSSDKHKSSKDKESSSVKKPISDSEKSHKESKSIKHSGSSSSEKHKSSSSHKIDSSSDKRSNSDKHKSDKHKSSSQSHGSDKEKHKSSSEKETSKHKTRDGTSNGNSSVEKHSSSSKDKSKDRSSSSKEKSSSDKKHSNEHKSSSSSNSKVISEKNCDKNSDRKSSHKSSSTHKSSRSSSSSTKKEDVPKKKVQINERANSDDGIDCGSGASFAEALGMISPVKPKKKCSSYNCKDMTSPNSDMSPASLLSPSAKLAPLPAIEISALPEISPNYKPRPPPRPLPHFNEEEAMSHVISSKNQRTKVYSGNKVMGKVPTLYEMCVQVLQEHIDALEFTGGVPYEILKPVVDKATPRQLYLLEHYNNYLMEDTDHLWKNFCQKHFRNKQRQEMETWREMYTRCEEEQEHRLKSLTANIKIAQEAKKAPIKQTKMAYVDSVVKPPRNIAKKQATHGTARMTTASPAARVASLAGTPNVLRGGAGVRAVAAPPTSVASAFKPKKAPLMAKALQIMRGRKR